MASFTEDELKTILKRASILQKYHQQTISSQRPFLPDEQNDVYDIAKQLDINPQFVKEAILEYQGIEVSDPVAIETGTNYTIEIHGDANGIPDASTLQEFRAQLEYHFNTVGKITRRKNSIFWNAKPSFPAKWFSINHSPELEIQRKKGTSKFILRQNIRTLNKLYIAPLFASFGAVMMITSVIYNAVGENDAAPMIIFGSLFLLASYAFTRFVSRLKTKRRRKLLELTETLQQIMERRFIQRDANGESGRSKQTTTTEAGITIEDIDSLSNEPTATTEIRINQKE